MSYDITYDNPECYPHVKTYHNQEAVSQESLDMNETRLSSFVSQIILDSIRGKRGHRDPITLNTSCNKLQTLFMRDILSAQEY